MCFGSFFIFFFWSSKTTYSFSIYLVYAIYIAAQALILWVALMINRCRICDENLVMIVIHLLHVGIASTGSHTAKVAPLSVHVRVVGASGSSSPLHEYSIICVARNGTEMSGGVVTEFGSAVGGSAHTK